MNYLLYRFKYRYGKYLPLKSPVDVSLELSSYCNNACNYCYHSDRKNLPFKKGFMSYELAEKVILEAEQLGVHSLKFNYRGEATMNPNFKKITTLAKSLAHGSTFVDRLLNSNFNFRIDREDIFEGLLNQTKIKVSFDSFIPEIFEKQRAGSNYQKTIANIDRFYNYPGRNNELVIQSVRTKLNANEDLEYEIKRRWPSATASIRDMVEGRVNKDLTEMVNRKRDIENRQSCIQAHVRLIIGHDGKVNFCCPDIGGKLSVFDANHSSLYAIFNSHYAKELRKSLKNKSAFNKEPCKGCSSFESYKGFKPTWNS